jgi:hypothetical protein
MPVETGVAIAADVAGEVQQAPFPTAQVLVITATMCPAAHRHNVAAASAWHWCFQLLLRVREN